MSLTVTNSIVAYIEKKQIVDSYLEQKLTVVVYLEQLTSKIGWTYASLWVCQGDSGVGQGLELCRPWECCGWFHGMPNSISLLPPRRPHTFRHIRGTWEILTQYYCEGTMLQIVTVSKCSIVNSIPYLERWLIVTFWHWCKCGTKDLLTMLLWRLQCLNQ